MPNLILKSKPKRKIGTCRGCKRKGYVKLGKKGETTPTLCPNCNRDIILEGPYPGVPRGFFGEGPDFLTNLDKVSPEKIWTGGRDE